MRFNKKHLILCLMGSFLLVSCGSKKEENQSTVQQQAEPPCVSQSAVPGQKKETPLTPEEKEQLEINEDNVMTPFPG